MMHRRRVRCGSYFYEVRISSCSRYGFCESIALSPSAVAQVSFLVQYFTRSRTFQYLRKIKLACVFARVSRQGLVRLFDAGFSHSHFTTPQIDTFRKTFWFRREDTHIQPTCHAIYRGSLVALLLVCRQVHAKAALLPFHKFEFSLSYNCDNTFNLLMATFTKEATRDNTPHGAHQRYTL
jgi:hypothetical protein